MNSHTANQLKSNSRRPGRSMSLLLAASKQDTQIVQSNLAVAPRPARAQLVAEAAYHRAESRHFESGHELDDWLAAEAEVDTRLGGEGRAY